MARKPLISLERPEEHPADIWRKFGDPNFRGRALKRPATSIRSDPSARSAIANLAAKAPVATIGSKTQIGASAKMPILWLTTS